MRTRVKKVTLERERTSPSFLRPEKAGLEGAPEMQTVLREPCKEERRAGAGSGTRRCGKGPTHCRGPGSENCEGNRRTTSYWFRTDQSLDRGTQTLIKLAFQIVFKNGISKPWLV